MIYLASDHRGFELKEKIKTWLTEWGYEFQDFGAFEYNQDDDYPDFVHKAAQKVSENPENNKAIILGSSGQGEAMTANRYKGVRAAVFYGPPFQFKKMPWYRWLFIFGRGIRTFQKTEFSVSQTLIKLSREHNNANILSLGASFIEERAIMKLIRLWLEMPFSGEERHVRRISNF